MHDNSQDLCRQFVEGLIIHKSEPLRIADVGSFDVNGTYRNLFNRPSWEYVGFDIREGNNVDVVLSSPDNWVLPAEYREAFDVVISGQVMEHVPAPWRWIKNIVSLCKPGGIVWLAVPNTEVFHEYPLDCWRCWPDGMRAILSEAGLKELLCFAKGPDTVGIGRKPE